jgi:hypothetical protein
MKARSRKRVHAHTNAEGFHLLTGQSTFDYTIRIPGFPDNPFSEVRTVGIAYSMKTPTTTGGVAKLDTEYCRKVGRIYPSGTVDFISASEGYFNGSSHPFEASYHFTADTPVHPRGVELSASPFGDGITQPYVAVDPDMVRQSFVEAKLKVQDLQLNLIEDLVQAKATVSLLADIYHLLISLWKYTRTGNYARLQHELNRHGYTVTQRLSNAWLAWHYGIMPVVRTFETLYQNMNDPFKDRRKYNVQRTVNNELDPHDLVHPKVGMSVTGRAVMSVRTTLSLAATGNGISTLDALNESFVGFSNLPALGWALAPYSFVIDWLIPVEDWLKSATFFKHFVVLRAYQNRNIYADCYALNKEPGVLGLVHKGQLPFARVKIAHTQRTNVNPYLPGLPYVNASLTPTKLISAAALLNQRR